MHIGGNRITAAAFGAALVLAMAAAPSAGAGDPVAPTSAASGRDAAPATRTYAWPSDDAQRSLPTRVVAPPGVRFIDVAAGVTHNLAVGSNGRVYAWGRNDDGQLGVGDKSVRTEPTEVALPADLSFVAVEAGWESSYAVAEDGTLYAWGGDDYGELGTNSYETWGSTDELSPVTVRLPDGVGTVDVAAGAYFAIVIGTDDVVYAWGDDAIGQLGSGQTHEHPHLDGRLMSPEPVPVTLPEGTEVRSLAAGGAHAVALTDDGTLFNWGLRLPYNVEVGGPQQTEFDAVPVVVPLEGDLEVRAVAAGSGRTIVTTTDGAAYSWGDNTSGQLGDGSTEDSTEPVRFELPAGVRAVEPTSGYFHSSVLTSRGKVYSAGIDEMLGIETLGSWTVTSTPVAADLPLRARVTALDTMWARTLALVEMVPAPPSAPRNVEASPRDGAAQVSWRAPRRTNGAPVTSYRIVARAKGEPIRFCTVHVEPGAKRAKYRVGDLASGARYKLRVMALNSAGKSDPSKVVTVRPR